ncbi:type I phosphomannose isomerase catalytic subunit [Psychroflexus lacisalsi]|uniref:Class I mannose-6-phosphate isomerase n=1 Tax=Psychroflexus lacisalsi TaxID=503928 RepID=A0ABN1KCN4_9FLAO|nr:type I phosphomannose isomerase catalytic subunit [Psychroflexus lacisalsi]MBZ9620037.1 class I mannose-6-phosphate isomerase [Psychroflexus lacisalsi]
MLYPLKFTPILKEKIWGGYRFHSKTNQNLGNKKIGESWEISGVKNEISIVENGDLKGKTLEELITEFKDQLLGKSVYQRFNAQFPILIKFIEAKDNLSVQLHPDDQLAKKRHNSFGKTEMWYIIESENNAKLILDFKDNLSIKKLKDVLRSGKIENSLNSINVKEGDAFFIKPGLVHAIGAGVLLAEIQQTSDITYRIYDWNRVDEEGNSRELHTDLALEAINFDNKSDFRIRYDSEFNTKVSLVDTPYFKTKFLEINKDLSFDYSKVDSFIILMNVGQNSVTISHQNIDYSILSQETILIPACIDTLGIKSGGTKLLEISI